MWDTNPMVLDEEMMTRSVERLRIIERVYWEDDGGECRSREERAVGLVRRGG